MNDIVLQTGAEIADRLGRAFGVWRLRPGDLEQASYVTACERLASVVPAGGVDLGVHGAAFLAGDDQRVDARAAGALAEALYRLGIERLRVHRAPSPVELHRFLDAVDGATDRDELYQRLAHVARVLEPVSIAPTTVSTDEVTDLESWHEVWDRLGDPARTADELVAAAGSSASDDEADALLRQLVALRDLLPDARQRSPELADRLHAIVLQLPLELRLAVARRLVDAPDTAFHGWLLSAVNDHDLALLLDGVDDDVAGLAQRVLGRDLSDLSTETALPAAPGPAELPPDVDDATAAVGSASVPLGTDSLELYLCLETRPSRQRAALLHWQRRVRTALRAGDLATVHDLLGLLHRLVAVAEHDLAGTLDAACHAVLGHDEVVALLPPPGEPLPRATEELLRAFGPIAVDAVTSSLVTEADRQRRSQLVAVLASLVPGHTNALAHWIDDPRWFVVRNVVTALWRAADPAAVPLLARAATNPEPRVRQETARALAAVGAVEHLAALAGDVDADVRSSARRLLAGIGSPAAAAALADVARDEHVPAADRRAALDALASHPHGRAPLRALADGNDLPFRLRWHAGRAASGGAG